MKKAAGYGGHASPAGEETSWYSLDGVECAGKLGVDSATGLGAAEAARRLEVYGLNQLTGQKKRPLWRSFLLQYRPQMQMVLIGAAVVSALIGNLSTMGVLVGVSVLNAVLGMLQESKAQRSVDSLKDLLVQEAHARRDGKVIAIPAASLVPGDIVMIRTGDRIPADGRLLSVANLEVEESSLTGESSPVSKAVEPINTPDVALGDRTNMLFMNTNAMLGSEKFGIGPTAVVLTQPGKWTFGLLANQIWSTSGAKDREDVNRTYLQPFMHYNLGSGLSVGASAEATGNWEADDEKWSGPLLFDVSKVTKLGQRPMKFKVAAGPSFGPAAGPEWRFRFAAEFLFPR